ncbi:hypothetical protein DH2020_032173 [Rehmannia glutinosa]|uniref:Protein kinase domain-containing protein n=1 Tax=Rehmannia glutinosa TaxID=99300 RepID=A0ABR0VG43_REHGL
MASDSSETTRRKHHRPSSTDDAEEHSKRRKHRHHHRHRHHRRHRSSKDKEETTAIATEELENKKIDEIEVEARKLENNGDEGGGSLGEVLVSGGTGFAGVDYEMEEGEIVEDDGLVDYVNADSEKSKENLHSDIELGEIETNGYDDSNMGVNKEGVERVDKKLRKLGKDSVDGKESGEVDHERLSNSEGLANGDYEKKYQHVDNRFFDGDGKRTSNSVDEVERKSLRKSSSSEKRSRAVSHSHSNDKYLKESSHSNLLRSPEWSREGLEGSKERHRNRDRSREKEKEEMERDRERNRHKDRYRREREQEILKDRFRDRDKEHERDRDWEREREGKGKGRGGERRIEHRRNSEDYHREGPRKSDLENESSKNKQNERGNENLEREDDRQEDYQDKIAMQLAEQEEDDLEKIKEESRRRRQAILEKYKNQHQQRETHSQDMVKDQVGESSAQVTSAEVLSEKTDNRVEVADIYVPEPSFSVGKSPSQNGLSALQMPTGTGGLGEGSPKSERLDDMFCDDIFGDSPAGVRKAGKGDGVAVEKSGLHDNWDDAEGYYGYRFGEVLDGRYEIIAAHGKGVFSTVVRAKDLKAKPGDPEEVAIKIIRNKRKTMYKAGMEELVILKKLVGTDPENKRHFLKKFGRNIGLKLTAVRAYAKQLFIALKHLKNCGVLHCDIKPDNMLVNEAKNVLKLCDFGNAMFAVLGLSYDHPMDVWSVGCCLFELYTGKVLFPGATNNDMLRLHMELKGPFPKKMLRKGAFTDQHFDHDLNFLATEEDPVSKKAIRRLVVNIKPKDFGTLISGSPGEDPKMVANFKDLMEKIFVLDPDKRTAVALDTYTFWCRLNTELSNWAFICLCHPCVGGRIQETLTGACLKFLEMILREAINGEFFPWTVFCFYLYYHKVAMPLIHGLVVLEDCMPRRCLDAALECENISVKVEHSCFHNSVYVLDYECQTILYMDMRSGREDILVVLEVDDLLDTVMPGDGAVQCFNSFSTLLQPYGTSHYWLMYGLVWFLEKKVKQLLVDVFT